MKITIGSIDLYCERIEAAFWAEPVNALTNASFLVSAYLLWALLKRKDAALTGHFQLMVFLIAAIGIGSFLFHTFATSWARWLDVAPILVFQVYFIGAYLTCIIKIKPRFVVLILCSYLAAAILARLFSDILNGSMIYAPAVIGLTALALWQFRRQRHNRNTLLLALIVFISSVFFRTIDNEVCELFPLGTHFLWHILNGLLVYLLGYSLVAHSVNNNR